MARIVVVAGFSESLVRFRLQFLQAMVVAGHEVIALGPEHDTQTVTKLAEEGIQFRPYFLERNGMNVLRDLRSLAGLIRIFRELHPDMVFAYTIKPVIYGSLAARLAGVRRMHSMITGLGYAFLGGHRRRLLNYLVRWLYGVALKTNGRVFFQNQDDMALFVEAGLVSAETQAVLVKGSGVDLNHYASSIPQGKDSYLMIARLLRSKGVIEYVEAARILKRRYPYSIFRLAGWMDDNPDSITRQELNGWIAEGVIEFLGRLRDVRPALSECTVYVLPSYREGTPRSVVEAMAIGRAVVTTDAPGCRETVVDGDNGFLVPVKSTEKLVTAMERFLREPNLAARMGLRSRVIAESRYDVHKVNEVMLREMNLQ